MSERLRVDASERLLAFLRRALPAWKRSTLEQRIRARCVRVNGAVVARNDFVAVGDEVVVGDRDDEIDERPPPAGIVILHEDDELVAIDKPAGLLAVSSEDERERTALALLRAHLSGPAPRGRALRSAERVELVPVHRIDRETSGVLLFARSRAVCDEVRASWGEAEKLYVALVEGRPSPSTGTIDEPLFEDKALFVRVGRSATSKDARTRYRTIEAGARRSLLEVELDTGRRHQIRAHLAWLGHPVVGDPRYGTKDARLFLHARKLVVPRRDGTVLHVEASVPRGFRAS